MKALAVEAKRGCGYREIHGLYLCGDGWQFSCDRLPWNLTVCGVCGQGLHVTRAPMKIGAKELFGSHENCAETVVCPFCAPEVIKSAYMLGVGRKYYTPNSFREEAKRLGISKRIATIPKDFELGETWVFLAHPNAGTQTFVSHDFGTTDKPLPKCTFCGKPKDQESWDRPECIRKVPAIFYAFRPARIEYLIYKSEATPEHIAELERRGLTIIVVPDGDHDHKSAKGPHFKKEPKAAKGVPLAEFAKVLGSTTHA